MSKATAGLKLALGLIFFNLTCHCFGALRFGFYDGKCGSSDVEDIVQGVISSRCKIDPTTTAALLHMQFHDCFVNVRSFFTDQPLKFTYSKFLDTN